MKNILQIIVRLTRRSRLVLTIWPREFAQVKIHEDNITLQTKYKLTAWFYDILDYPWERVYKHWRPLFLEDLRGEVLELGSGTGRNFQHYHSNVNLTAVDLSDTMLAVSKKRAKRAKCKIDLKHEDATLMTDIPSNYYDWVISTFMCCVMPDHLQPQALEQMLRILKPGGKFRLLEIIYSKNPKINHRQKIFAPFVAKIYGARFDRKTLQYLQEIDGLEITCQKFLKDDTYLFIEGYKK
jgi:phosphatidylethanolamine/phosphatidyl-N-methylethanolamine N-methyltransferase